jgi:DNA-binding FadR family transcriptional regulator
VPVDSTEIGSKRDPLPVAQRRTEKISEVVAREIVHDMRGLPPATMLPSEVVMLTKYQIGRASLREALRILEVQGLIIIRPGPGGGPMVAPVDSRHFARMASLYLHLSGATYRDVTEARLVMEPVMARLAAERSDEESVAVLQRFLDPPTGVLNDVEYFRTATDFHGLLSGMSSNPVLNLMGRSLKDMYTDRLENILFAEEDRLQIHKDHAAIAKAVIDRKPDRAEKLMRAHMVAFVAQAASNNPGVLDDIVDWH